MAAARAWQPVLHGHDAERARRAIAHIAGALRQAGPAWNVGASLANGDAGLAICYAYLGELDAAGAFIERAIDTMASSPLPTSLHHGYAGVAWATEHLIGRVIEPSEHDLGAGIDDALLVHVRDVVDNDYDLLDGLVGLGVYAIERSGSAGPRSAAEGRREDTEDTIERSGSAARPVARELLATVVARLDGLAIRSPEGACWITPSAHLDPDMAARCPNGVVNLGLAHGVPCAIALLAACVHHDVAAPIARPLLDDAVRWLLAHELPAGGIGRFTDLVASELEATPARLGWCYGDLSVASALVVAGDQAGRAQWRDAGLELARGAAMRDRDTTGVRDACVCHGAAGLGLMFARLAHAAGGDPTLEAAAASWYRATLDLEQPEHPVRFPPFVTDPKIPLGDASVGLLTGAAGVALALQAAVTDVEPAWDRVLLLSALAR